MREMKVDPYEIFGFYIWRRVDHDLLRHVSERGFEDIPKVPVFRVPLEIPEEMRGRYEFLLMDGNRRMAVARALNLYLPCAVYDYGERIDTEKDKLAPFRGADKPEVLYPRIMNMFKLRDTDISIKVYKSLR